MTDPVLKAANLSKRFTTGEGEVRAVEDVSLQLAPGEFVALHGPSGCGKSTLLLMAGGLLSPDDGALEIVGRDPYKLSVEERTAFRGQHIGFVFQQFHLIPFLDVLDNVRIGFLAANGSDEGEKLDRRAKELLERFQLDHRLHHTPSRLSVGEQQRVALARALLRSPNLVLADEPTGNLDAENAGIILNHLAEFAGEGGTVLMVTHDERAREKAARSVELNGGRIVE